MAEEHEHVVSPVIYISVLIALMVLLALTLVAAFYDLDRKLSTSIFPYWNMTVAVLIAICKAFLIVLFFMHVKYASKVTWAFAGAAFVWLGIMMTLSLSDYVTREYPSGTPASAQIQPNPSVIRTPARKDAVVPGASAVPAHAGESRCNIG